MENKYYIYLHIKLTNGEPFYIGKGTGKRCNESYGRSKWWDKVVTKYGYDIIILEDGLTEEEAFEKEVYWIDRIGRKKLNNGPLINLTDGGEGVSGLIHNEETKEKLRIASIGNTNMLGKKHSEESKNKISINRTGKLMGENNPMCNKTVADKVSEKLKGNTNGLKYHTDEERKQARRDVTKRYRLKLKNKIKN